MTYCASFHTIHNFTLSMRVRACVRVRACALRTCARACLQACVPLSQSPPCCSIGMLRITHAAASHRWHAALPIGQLPMPCDGIAGAGGSSDALITSTNAPASVAGAINLHHAAATHHVLRSRERERERERE
jgi:hypothetical protein